MILIKQKDNLSNEKNYNKLEGKNEFKINSEENKIALDQQRKIENNNNNNNNLDTNSNDQKAKKFADFFNCEIVNLE